jgi:hypothetical protein
VIAGDDHPRKDLATMLAVTVVSWISSGVVVPTVLYIGPDVFMPLTSAIAAVAGIALMFGQRIVAAARSAWRAVFPPRD